MANIKTNNVAIAATVMLASPVLLNGLPSGQCLAADFRHVKKVIVPASAIPRRYDYSASAGTEAVPSSGTSYSSYGSSYGSSSYASSSSSSSSSSKAGKYGLVPPPPPVVPSLLPSTFAAEAAAPTYGSGFARSASGTPQSGYQRVSGDPRKRVSGDTHSVSADPTNRFSRQPYRTNADPTRDTSLDRHVAASDANKEAAEHSLVTRITSQADGLVKEGKLHDAQDLLEKYHHQYPKNTTLTNKLSEVSLDRAKYYLHHSDYVEAAKQARAAVAYDPHNSHAKTVLDEVLRHHGLNPSDGVNRIKMGDLLLSQGKLKEAHVEYEAAAKSPTTSVHAEALVGLGNIAMRENKLKEAKAQYQLALEKAPNSHVALRQMGLVRYKLKDVVGANADLSRALVLEQNDKLAGQALVELWQRQVSASPKDANAHLGLARAFQLSGDLKAAQNEYRMVVNIDPNHPNLPAARQSFKLALARQEAIKHYEAAKTLDSQGALNEAYGKVSESVRLSPGETKFKLYQAELAERLALYPDAKHMYLEVLRQDPKNVHAAQRIKALSELIAQHDTTRNLRGPIDMKTTSGSLTPQAVPATLAASPPGLPGSPRFNEGPPLPTLPKAPGTATVGPSPDPVQNMSGFLTSLRNYMFVQKKELQKQEDSVLETIGAAPKSSSSSSKLAGLDPLPAAPGPLSLPKNMITSSDVSKLLAGIKKTPTAGASATAATAGSLPPVAPPIAPSNILSTPAGLSAEALEGTLAPTVSQAMAPPAVLPASNAMPPVASAMSSAMPATAAALAAAAGYPEGAGMITTDAPLPNTDLSAPPLTGAPGQMPGIPQASGLTDLNSLAQALGMNPNDLAAAARSFGIDPNNIPALAQQFGITANNVGNAAQQLGINPSNFTPDNIGAAAQQLGITPDRVAAFAQQAPAIAKQQLSNVKEEDLDKAYGLLKKHVALKQELQNGAPITAKGEMPPLAPPRIKKSIPTLSSAGDIAPARTASGTATDFMPIPNAAIGSAAPLQGYDLPSMGADAIGSSATGDSVSTPASAFTAGDANNRLGSLEAQNKALLAQLERTKQQLQELQQKSQKSTSRVPDVKSGAETGSLAAPSNEVNLERIPAHVEPPTGALPPDTTGSAPANLPVLPPRTTTSGAVPNGIAGSANSGQLINNALAIANPPAPLVSPAIEAAADGVRLELSGVTVKPTSVRLNVVMRNTTDKELVLPSTTRAIVRMVGIPDQTAKVKFPVKKLASGAEAKGFITVSGHKLDPSADVLIPNLVSSASGPRDVHLTVPISALSSNPR